MQQKEKDWRVDLAFYETAIQKEKLKTGGRDEEKLRAFESRYFARNREYEQLMARLEKSYPHKYKAQTAAPDEVQAALDNQTAVLEYFLGDSSIYAFALTKADVKIYVIRKASSFQKLVTAMAGSLKNVTSKAEYLRSAAQLYRILLKPLEPLCAEKRRWIIIPDGELHQIPFEALLAETVAPQSDADYRTLPYLIKQREISYHYSATLFLKSLQENSGGSYANLFAGFAPVFDAAAKNGVIYRGAPEDSSAISPVDSSFLATRDGKTLEPLPYSAQEVQDILTAFPGRSRAFLQQEASEENFKRQIKGYKYVHLATHGRIVDENPQLSNLAFSQSQDSRAKEDGILYSAETYNLDLNAGLLVLSACQTGAGQIVKGEGLMGLTRSFLYSGARNIVTSLWKVYDQHTSQLMVEMYRQIAAGKSYSAALREAKLKMIAKAETAGPQSWTSFVLIGR
jgi:CHAT domain-containing protein